VLKKQTVKSYGIKVDLYVLTLCFKIHVGISKNDVSSASLTSAQLHGRLQLYMLPAGI